MVYLNIDVAIHAIRTENLSGIFNRAFIAIEVITRIAVPHLNLDLCHVALCKVGGEMINIAGMWFISSPHWQL